VNPLPHSTWIFSEKKDVQPVFFLLSCPLHIGAVMVGHMCNGASVKDHRCMINREIQQMADVDSRFDELAKHKGMQK
jgi:hypothetical protein